MTLSNRLADIFSELFLGLQEFVFPNTCCVCAHRLSSGIRFICIRCRAEFTTLDLHHLPENVMTDRFWGRIPIERAAALLPYNQGAPAQRIMWLLKYDNRPELGFDLGAWFGNMLNSSETFGPVDAIVPVPLHPKKQRKRGYNQAERIASGLAETIDSATAFPNAVRRTVYTETQTKKSKFERMENVEGVFQLSQKQALRGKHVLLVDDVMTTGATLEMLGRVVLEANPASLKIACLALARND